MAAELQVTIALISTEPEVPGNPGVMVRAARSSTLVSADGDELSDEFAIARHRLGALVEEVRVDVDTQLEMYEKQADA